MKIAVIGGGPAGLFFAIITKKRQPQWQITVHEQNAHGATFGFGVVVADTGLARLREADAESHDALVACMLQTDRQTIAQAGMPIDLVQPKPGGGAIARLQLLQVLQGIAQRLGVSLRYGERVSNFEALDADLVIGADGVNSALRAQSEQAFGTTRRLLSNHFAWFGTTRVFANPALIFRKHLGGHFVAHYYPYCDSMSTFVAECDDATWQRLHLGEATDTQRQSLVEAVFAPELHGHALIANNNTLNTIWRQFPVIRNAQWHAGKQVLIGDALSSAHFSIGSGTRIAMEDAAALAHAVLTHPDSVPAALAAFVAERKPHKDRLIEASEKSFDWYEAMAQHMDRLSPHAFVHSYMTRTGRVDDARLAAMFPAFMAERSTMLLNK